MFTRGIVHTRIRRVICTFLQMPSLNCRCEITPAILPKECAAILQDFFAHRAASKMEIYTPADPDFRSEVVICLGPRCELVRLLDNEQGRLRKFWPKLSYVANGLIVAPSPRSLSLR
jgi:hypothetical protein